jgi:hypothetical protein
MPIVTASAAISSSDSTDGAGALECAAVKGLTEAEAQRRLAARGTSRPAGLSPLGLVVLSEQLRPDARSTVDYFRAASWRRGVVVGAMCARLALLYALALAFPFSRDFFELSVPGPELVAMALAGAAIAVLALYLSGFVPGRSPAAASEPEA